VQGVKLNRVFVDGGSSLNILFLKAFDQMGLPRSALQLCRDPFHGVIPGMSASPIGQITLLVTFRTQENFYMQFEVANFEMAYNTFLGRHAITKFMAIPHYAYLVLKMLDPKGVINVKGDVKLAYDYDRESCEIVDAVLAATELQSLKKTLAESLLDPMMPESKTSKLSIQPEDKLIKTIQLCPSDPCQVMHIENNLDHK
jgi:hypothetical protein